MHLNILKYILYTLIHLNIFCTLIALLVLIAISEVYKYHVIKYKCHAPYAILCDRIVCDYHDCSFAYNDLNIEPQNRKSGFTRWEAISTY